MNDSIDSKFQALESELELVFSTGECSSQEVEEIKKVFSTSPDALKKEVQGKEKESNDLRTLLADMTVPEKLKLAMFGNGVARALLIQDSSRLVQSAVLSNPQLQESDIETFAKNKNVSEYVLRSISNDRTWMKNYSVKVNLVFNSKTPIDVSTRYVKFLRKNDLGRLARSKDVPQAVALAARKLNATRA